MGEKFTTQCATKVAAGGFPVAVGCHRASELTPAAFGNGGRIFVPANPGARIFKGTANDSPSPWGEGRVEGGHASQITP